jgi:hypothetical protein
MKATKNMKMNETISASKKFDQERIYIENYSPSKLSSKIVIDLLDNYFMCSNTYTQLLSSSGIFHIEHNKIYKMNPVDKPITICKNYAGNINLLIDKSIYEKELVYSQIPYDHVSTNMVFFQYSIASGNSSSSSNSSGKKISKKSPNLILVVEGTYSEKQIDLNSTSTTSSKSETNKYHHFVPTNMYFLAMEDINNYLMKEELVEFLSVLF